jgi:sugar phosphate isomerase/epimerase
MKVVCTTCCYRGLGRDELTETLDGAPRAGYRYIDVHELDLPDDNDAARRRGEEVRRRCLARGLEPVAVHAAGLGGRDAQQLDEQVRAITVKIAFCDGLGADRVVSTGANRRGDAPLANVIECLERLLPALERTPIKIGIEPHHGNVIERLEDYEQILTALDHPEIGICPDIGHFHASGVDVYRLLAEHGERVVYTHIKDHIGPQSVGIGRGEIDVARFVKTLFERGYDGSLGIELEHEDKENTQLYAAEARSYLDGVLATLSAG